MAEESKKDILLKRVQITLAILGSVATVLLGFYNVRKVMFADNSPGDLAVSVYSDKAAIEGAFIEIMDSENALVATLKTSRDGAASKKGLAAGNYALKVNRKGYENQLVTVKIRSKKTSEIEVILRATTPGAGSPIRSALEEAGASWIKKIGKSDSSEAS